MKRAITLLILSILAWTGLEAQVREITSQEFSKQVFDYTAKSDKDVFLGSKPAIVDFYASWCAPCRTLSPILEELSEKYKGAINFYKVDIDQNKSLAVAYSIKSIPTMLFCKVNGEVSVIKGAASQEALEEIIKSFLLKK